MPADKLLDLQEVIHEERDRKLEEARETRRQRRATKHAQRQPRAKQYDRHRPPIDYAHLRRSVSIEDVLRDLGFWDSMKGSGPQRRGPCPLHDRPDDKYRSFAVNTTSNVYCCFHPECQSRGNVLDLWVAIKNEPLYDAAYEFSHTFAIELTPEKQPSEQIEKQEPVTQTVSIP